MARTSGACLIAPRCPRARDRAPKPPRAVPDVLAPGLRVAMDTGGDMGVVELGIAGLLGVSSNGHYDSLLRVDLRMVF